MIFLAHRGLWTEPGQRNTRSALQQAFALGFGVETDVRDLDGRLVISHDMPVGDPMPFSTLLADYEAAGRPGYLAINVKADGLAAAIEHEMAAFDGMASQAFVFDMSVPDTLGYFGRAMRVFTRHSEYEPFSPLEGRADGIWMDCFVTPWVDPAAVVDRLKRGQMLALVSPELHKRDTYELFWRLLDDALSAANLPPQLVSKNLMLCTDFPREAATFFGKGKP